MSLSVEPGIRLLDRVRRGAVRRFSPFFFALLLTLSGEAYPARIVSTLPSVTETVFALGAGDRVVGVSTYCRYPPAVLSLPKVGTYTKPDPEKIALLRPDLVIIQRSANALADRLSALGIHYLEVGMGSLEEVYSMIRDIGIAIGAPANAEKLNGDIRSHFDSLRAGNRGKLRPTVLMVVGRTPGLLTNLIAVGPSAYLGELLEIAGGSNVLSGTSIAYPHISLETVVRLNPDVILDLSMMGDAGSDPAPQEARLRQPWLAHKELSAVQSGLVFGMTSETLVAPGPRVIEAVELIRAKLRQKEDRP
jgi:iron complex transport system substrate-binding protein